MKLSEKRCVAMHFVFVMGEDVGRMGGLFKVTQGLLGRV